MKNKCRQQKCKYFGSDNIIGDCCLVFFNSSSSLKCYFSSLCERYSFFKRLRIHPALVLKITIYILFSQSYCHKNHKNVSCSHSPEYYNESQSQPCMRYLSYITCCRNDKIPQSLCPPGAYSLRGKYNMYLNSHDSKLRKIIASERNKKSIVVPKVRAHIQLEKTGKYSLAELSRILVRIEVPERRHSG